jgi:hypothetical protein
MRGEAFPTPQPGQAAPGEPDRELSRESLAGRSNGWIAEQLRQAAGLLAAQLVVICAASAEPQAPEYCDLAAQNLGAHLDAGSPWGRHWGSLNPR